MGGSASKDGDDRNNDKNKKESSPKDKVPDIEEAMGKDGEDVYEGDVQDKSQGK